MSPDYNSNTKHILVADDDPLLVMLLEHHLSAAGYQVVSAGDGADALARIESDAPDVLVLDSMMPVMGGAEVLRRLNAAGRLSALKVIVLTALSQEEHVVAALQLGAADFLAKPFSPEELVARVARFSPARAA